MLDFGSAEVQRYQFREVANPSGNGFDLVLRQQKLLEFREPLDTLREALQLILRQIDKLELF